VSNAAGQVAVAVGPNRTLLVTVAGPKTVEGGCVNTIEATLYDISGNPVPKPGTGGPMVHCMAIVEIDIPAGQSKFFTTRLQAPGPGHYTIRTALNPVSAGPLPDVAVDVK
jgi:hypothetical protein